MSARLSGVQREVNRLYRLLLRAAKVKDGGGWTGTTTALVRAEFREQVMTQHSRSYGVQSAAGLQEDCWTTPEHTLGWP